MKKERETKNKIRFAEVPLVGQPNVLDTIYIPKFFSPPDELTITIEPKNESK